MDNHSVVTTRIYRTITCNNYKRCNKLNKHGNINLELLANAVKAEMKEKSADGFVVNILNKPVRFGEDDVNQLVEIFKTFKQNN